MSTWVILVVLASAALHAGWNVLLHGGRDRLVTLVVMSVSMAATAAIMLPFLPIPARGSWPYLIISAALQAIYNLLLVHAYKQGDLGQSYPIARGSSPLLVLAGATVIVGERLTPLAILGILLISAGILGLALRGRALSARGVASAVAVGAVIAAYSVVDGIGVRLSGDPFAYLAWLTLLWAVPLPIILIATNPKRYRMDLPELITAALGGVIALAAYTTTVWAFKNAPLGPVSALRETSVLFALIFARYYLGERLSKERLIAVSLILLGMGCFGLQATR